MQSKHCQRQSLIQQTVARVKAAIAEGNYPVNSEAVAEKFAALESMIYGK